MQSKLQKAAWIGVFLLSFVVGARSQTLLIDGQLAGPVPVAPQAVTPIEIFGPTSAPLALAIGFVPADLPTPYGILGLSFAQGGFFALNAFDSTHPFSADSWLDDSGYLGLESIVFTAANPLGSQITFWAQCIVADPTAASGFVLGNTLEVQEHMPAPIVLMNSPNMAAIGGTLTIVGANFSSVPEDNVVTIGDRPCVVQSAASNLLGVVVPEGCTSGPVSVATPWGVYSGSTNAINCWCAIINEVIPEAQVQTITSGFTTIIGTIPFAGYVDAFTVHAMPGQEIYAECYSYDPNTGLLTGGSNSSNLYFDPALELRHGNVDLLFDDDSGPLTNAAIGLAWGNHSFVADMESDYQIRVRTVFTGFTGHYLLKVGLREPLNMPMRVHGVWPNLARAGDIISVWCSNTVAGNPEGHFAHFMGQTIPALSVEPGRIEFMLPAGSRSGPVSVTTPFGHTGEDPDRMSSWITILQNNMAWAVEGQLGHTDGSTTWFGALDLTSDYDVYRLQIRANHLYRVEVYAFDTAQTRVMTSTFVMGNPVDPELRMVPALMTSPILAMDSSSGPGLNAVIGSQFTPYYLNPQDTYVDIWVLSWFMGSSGSYLLNITEFPPGT